MTGNGAEAHIRQGEEHFSAGRIREAEQSFRAALASGERHPVALNNLGVLHFGEGDLAQAESLFAEALIHRPGYDEARDNLEAVVRAQTQTQSQRDAVASRTIPTGLKVGLIPGMSASSFESVFRRLARKNQVRPLKSLSGEDLAALAGWADIILALEGSPPLLELSRLIRGRRLVIHFQRDEIVSDAFMEGLDWNQVAGITFAAPHLMALTQEYWSKLVSGIPMEVVTNGVDLDAVPLSPRTSWPGRDIGVVGDINQGLGVDVLLQCLHEALALDSGYTFHILGFREDQRFVTYLEHLLGAMGLRDRMVIHDPAEGVSAFLGRMNALLSTSPLEGLPPTLLEAMARGIKPMVHDWPGARELFPPASVFRTLPEFRSLLADPTCDSRGYREWVAERYPLSRHLDGLEAFLGRLAR